MYDPWYHGRIINRKEHRLSSRRELGVSSVEAYTESHGVTNYLRVAEKSV